MSRSSRDAMHHSEEETERLPLMGPTSTQPEAAAITTAGTVLRTLSIPTLRPIDSSRNDRNTTLPQSPSEKSKGLLPVATGVPSPFQHAPSCPDTSPPAASPTHAEAARISARLSQSSSKQEGKQDSMSIPLCRICLEEDDCAALCEPCGCSGTQRHAHHACIQRWVVPGSLPLPVLPAACSHTVICKHDYVSLGATPAIIRQRAFAHDTFMG